MKILLLLLLCTALPVQAQPSRRSLIQQGENSQQDSAKTQLEKSTEAILIKYKVIMIPILGYSFRYPEDWTVGMSQDTSSKHGQYYHSDGDIVYVREEKYDETYIMHIYSKKFDEPTTIETVKQEWLDDQKQPDHDNVYEYSHLSYIRELDNIEETETTYLGKPALRLKYTGNNWSKFWQVHAIKFAWGKRIYTVKYRTELGKEDQFYEAYQELLRSFKFHGAEPNFDIPIKSGFADVSSSHRNQKAIARLRDLEIVGGYSDGSFKPDNTINRAEFIKIMTSEPLVPADELARCNTSSFPDVPPDAWFTQHVCVGKARGMIAGYPDGTFQPSKTISFVEAAKIIASFFEEVEEEEGEWFTPFVRGLERRKAIPISIKSLSSSISRGEMSEMIYRLYDRIEDDSLSLEDL